MCKYGQCTPPSLTSAPVIVPPPHQREVAVFPREEEVGVVHLDAFQRDVEALSGDTLHVITPGWGGAQQRKPRLISAFFPFASRLPRILTREPEPAVANGYLVHQFMLLMFIRNQEIKPEEVLFPRTALGTHV